MADETNGLMPDWTPEQKAAIYAEMKAKFTADDLYGYIEDTGEKFPAEQVLAEMEAIVREIAAGKKAAES